MLHGSAPKTLDLDRAFGRPELAGPREAPLAIVNPPESAIDYSALRDPSRFPVGFGTFRGERAVDVIPVPTAPAADLYQAEVAAKVRAWGGSTRVSEMHGHVPNGGTTAVEYVAAEVGTTRGADSTLEGPHVSWHSADTARGALIRLPTTAQYTSEPDRNGQQGAVLAARVTRVSGGRHGTATLYGEGSAERCAVGASLRARALVTRTYAAALHVAPHDAPHRTVLPRGVWIGGAEPTRRVAACSAPHLATTAPAWSGASRPPMAVRTTRVAIAPGVMPSMVLASTGHLVSGVETARTAPLRLAELGGRALGGLDRSAQDIASNRLEAYRLADLNGRVLGSLDGNAAPVATRSGSEGGALPVIGEHASERHARVEAQSEARRVAGCTEAPLREATHAVGAAGVARVQPTVRVCGDARAGNQPEPVAVGIAGPMARIVPGLTRREDSVRFR